VCEKEQQQSRSIHARLFAACSLLLCYHHTHLSRARRRHRQNRLIFRKALRTLKSNPVTLDSSLALFGTYAIETF
jgi:hypothetical protein